MKEKNKKIIIIFIIIILLIILMSLILSKGNNTNKIGGIKLAEEETELINLNLEIKEETDESYKCLLTFASSDENNKIKQIEYPAEEGKNPKVITVANEQGSQKVGIDYEFIKKDEDKTFKIMLADGKTQEKRTGYKITYKNGEEVFKVESRILTKTIPITNLSPIQEGKHFIGYSENKESQIADYFENGNAKINEDVTLYAIYTQEKNGYTQSIENESLIGKVSKINTSGVQEIEANGETYSANVIVENNDLVLDGEKQVQGASLVNKVYEFGDSTKDVATASEDAQNMVILKVNGNLTINSNVTLTACKSANGYGGPKGLFIYVSGTISNNGMIDMTARGARAQGQDVYLWQNANNTYEYIPEVGANGAISKGTVKYSYAGESGENGLSRQTGGGGSGAARGKKSYLGDSNSRGGAGTAGTSFSGGTGGGSGYSSVHASSSIASDAVEFGKDGGNGAGTGASGAGNPGGIGGSAKGENGTGGLLIIYTSNYTNNGVTLSKGSLGGIYSNGAGSSGGGSINIFYNNIFSSLGIVNADGGSIQSNGGAGGNGTVTIGNIKSGTFIKDEENK